MSFFPLPMMYPQDIGLSESIPIQKRLIIEGNKAYSSRMQKIAEGFEHQLPSWTIIILNDNQWKSWKKPNPSDSTFSILGANRTYVHEHYMRSSDDKIERSLAHELGHLTLKSNKEEDANRWADAYFKLKKKK